MSKNKKHVAIVGNGGAGRAAEAIRQQAEARQGQAKLRPVIIINVVDNIGDPVETVRLPYNPSDANALTEAITDLLEKYAHLEGITALPTTGYELNL